VPFDATTLTTLISAIGVLVATVGGVQLRRDAQARRERAELRREVGYQRRLLALAIRHIVRQDYVLAGADLPSPVLHPELEELIRGEYPDDRDPAPGPAARAGPDRAAHRRA
jgi:hypothetical protein